MGCKKIFDSAFTIKRGVCKEGMRKLLHAIVRYTLAGHKKPVAAQHYNLRSSISITEQMIRCAFHVHSTLECLFFKPASCSLEFLE